MDTFAPRTELMTAAVVGLMASNPPKEVMDIGLRKSPALKEAIDTASVDTLRQTLVAMCADPNIADLASKHMLLIINYSPNEQFEGGDGGNKKSVEVKTGKRAGTARSKKPPKAAAQPKTRPRPAVCNRCIEFFNVNANGEEGTDQCLHHPGTLRL